MTASVDTLATLDPSTMAFNLLILEACMAVSHSPSITRVPILFDSDTSDEAFDSLISLMG